MKIANVNDLGFRDLWYQLFLENDYQYPLYQPWNLEYYRAYAENSEFKDTSFVITENKTPVLGVRATVTVNPNGESEVSCFGLPLLYIENRCIDKSQRQGAYKILRDWLDNLLEIYPKCSIVYQDFLTSNSLSVVGEYLMESGSQAKLYFSRVIDLSSPEVELHSQIRKSYKNLINWGKKNLVIRILDEKTIKLEDIELFRQLHQHVSGRKTRSHQTWNLQYQMIYHKEAFAIMGEFEGDLVTAALFPYSSKYCYYGVSVSRRELFDKPLSHALIWSAMQYAKQQGCHFFELGSQLYSNQGDPIPNKKELNISTFKRGFGGRTQVRVNINS